MVMASQQVAVMLFLCALQGVYVPGVESLCTNGFTDNLMDTDIQSISTWSTFGLPSQWVFPSINFTCTGARITGWAFRARYNEFGPSAMLMQIWRYNETEGLYSKVQSSGSLNELVSPDSQVHGQSYVYEYNLNTPITVEENDLFGAEWTNSNERTQLEMWDIGNGIAPVSYRIQQRTDNISPTSTGLFMGTADRRFIPLVSVIIEENLSTTTTVALMPSPSSQEATAAPTMTSETPYTVSPSPPIDPGDGEESSSPAAAVAGAIVGVLVAIGVIVAIVIIIVCVLRKNKRGRSKYTTTMSKEEDDMLTNSAYVATTSTINTASHGNANAYEDIELYSDARQTAAETIPTEENAAYGNTTVDKTVPTEENAAYGNTTVGETIPTEENAAYGGTVWRDSHSQATTTFTVQPDELNQDSAVLDPEYEYIV